MIAEIQGVKRHDYGVKLFYKNKIRGGRHYTE